MEQPSKYILPGATEADQRQVRSSIETLMELAVTRIQAGVLTKLTPSVVESYSDALLPTVIAKRRDEIDEVLLAGAYTRRLFGSTEALSVG